MKGESENAFEISNVKCRRCNGLWCLKYIFSLPLLPQRVSSLNGIRLMGVKIAQFQTRQIHKLLLAPLLLRERKMIILSALNCY